MTTTYSQISFTEVAKRYNSINAIPTEASHTLGKRLAGLSRSRGPLLDMGCGAGRIALPTAVAGAQIVGVDISRDMLKAATAPPVPPSFSPLEGNIVALPFKADSFPVVLSINVLHLVPQWETVLSEALRVMSTGGIFVQGRDWIDPASCFSQMRWKLREIVMQHAPNLRPTAAASPQVLAEKLSTFGGQTGEPIAGCKWTQHISPNILLDQMKNRQFNETWMLPDSILAPAMETLSNWVGETWERPHETQAVARQFNLIVTTF